VADHPDSMFVDFPAKSTKRARTIGGKRLLCCASWRDYVAQHNDVGRAMAIVHTLAHSRVPFSVMQVVNVDGISPRPDVVRAIDKAVLLKWVYELDEHNLYRLGGPRLWQGKLR